MIFFLKDFLLNKNYDELMHMLSLYKFKKKEINLKQDKRRKSNFPNYFNKLNLIKNYLSILIFVNSSLYS